MDGNEYPTRYALVHGKIGDGKRIAAYLPANYSVIGRTAGGEFLIAGYDAAGWTLEDYVLPRLASGSIFGHIIDRFEEAI